MDIPTLRMHNPLLIHFFEALVSLPNAEESRFFEPPIDILHSVLRNSRFLETISALLYALKYWNSNLIFFQFPAIDANMSLGFQLFELMVIVVSL